MKRWTLARDDRAWCLRDADGRETRHTGPLSVAETLQGAGRVACICRDTSAVLDVAKAMIDHAHASSGPLPSVSVTGGGNRATLGGVAPARGEGSWHITTGAAMLGSGQAELAELDHDLDGDAAEAAAAVAELHDKWSETVSALGLDGDKLSAGTAAAGGLVPVSWIRASVKFAHTQPWLDVREAYAGGRIQCFQEGWEGVATEYDLRSAYGAALASLLGPMPDFQLYPGRRPMRAQPGWFDATVRVQGEPGPLPRRDPKFRWKLDWPTSGQWRQWFTKVDLETPGVEVVEIHAIHAGRYMHGMRDGVLRLLELREGADPWVRATIRQLVVSLAGKLGQRPVHWRVWDPRDARKLAPAGAVHIGGMHGGITVYPTTPDRLPPTIVPQVASYVTARTRAHLYGQLRAHWPGVIYCDTDGIHVPAGTWRGPEGDGPGEWAAKVTGPAKYHHRRRYYVGTKRVNC